MTVERGQGEWMQSASLLNAQCLQVDLEAARTLRPECTLNISSCTYNNSVINTVSPVTSLTFAVIQPYAFELGFVGLPATNLVSPRLAHRGLKSWCDNFPLSGLKSHHRPILPWQSLRSSRS